MKSEIHVMKSEIYYMVRQFDKAYGKRGPPYVFGMLEEFKRKCHADVIKNGKRTIITGSRSFASYDVVCGIIYKAPWPITEILTRCSHGVEKLGERYAEEHDIPVKKFPVGWSERGADQLMMSRADALIAIWGGECQDTAEAITRASSFGLEIYEQRIGALVSA